MMKRTKKRSKKAETIGEAGQDRELQQGHPELRITLARHVTREDGHQERQEGKHKNRKLRKG